MAWTSCEACLSRKMSGPWSLRGISFFLTEGDFRDRMGQRLDYRGCRVEVEKLSRGLEVWLKWPSKCEALSSNPSAAKK
jgi:hypothetical protein